MTRTRKGAEPGGNRPRALGAGVDEAIREANAVSAAVRAQMEADGARVMRALGAKEVRDPRWPSKVRRLSASAVSQLGYQPPTRRYVSRSYRGGTVPLPAGHPWLKPGAPGVVTAGEARLRALEADRRQRQEIRALARLDAINEAFKRRASPAAAGTPPAYVCPTCGRASWHPEDARNKFCGVCGLEADRRRR